MFKILLMIWGFTLTISLLPIMLMLYKDIMELIDDIQERKERKRYEKRFKDY